MVSQLLPVLNYDSFPNLTCDLQYCCLSCETDQISWVKLGQLAYCQLTITQLMLSLIHHRLAHCAWNPNLTFLEGSWKAPGRHLEGSWKAPERLLEGSLKAPGSLLEASLKGL